jgi:hypothetical protein
MSLLQEPSLSSSEEPYSSSVALHNRIPDSTRKDHFNLTLYIGDHLSTIIWSMIKLDRCATAQSRSLLTKGYPFIF